MKFVTKYNCFERNAKISSESGSPIADVYGSELVDGKEVLKVVAHTNLQELIDSERDAVDINRLMERFKDGEVDVFDRVNGFYADVSDMPTTYAEMHQRLNACNDFFNSLDPELRDKFNNSPIEFFDQYGSEEFIAKVNEHLGISDAPQKVASTDFAVDRKEVIDEQSNFE